MRRAALHRMVAPGVSAVTLLDVLSTSPQTKRELAARLGCEPREVEALVQSYRLARAGVPPAGGGVMIHHGAGLDVMPTLDAESIDAIVTDPPYGLEFMGKEWDKLDAGLPQEAVWKGRRGKGGSSIGTDDSKPQRRHHVGYGGGQQGVKRCTTCWRRGGVG